MRSGWFIHCLCFDCKQAWNGSSANPCILLYVDYRVAHLSMDLASSAAFEQLLRYSCVPPCRFSVLGRLATTEFVGLVELSRLLVAMAFVLLCTKSTRFAHVCIYPSFQSDAVTARFTWIFAFFPFWHQPSVNQKRVDVRSRRVKVHVINSLCFLFVFHWFAFIFGETIDKVNLSHPTSFDSVRTAVNNRVVPLII